MTRRRRKPSEIRMLGVDPSLTATGLCAPQGASIALKNNKRGWDRIHYILEKTAKQMDLDPPTHVCMEGYAMGIAGKGRVFDLAELGGVMKLLFLSRGLPIILVPPSTLKIYASDKGNAKKEFVMKEVKRRWGRSFVSSDMADAFALKQFGIDYLLGAKESVGEVRALGKAELIESTECLQTFANMG